MLFRADLHTHTTASDGLLTPAKVVARATNAGIQVLGITDHDSLAGVEDGLAESARRNGPEIVAGVELTAYHQSVELHLLGLFVDADNAELNGLLARAHQARRDRVVQIARRLATLGVQLDPEAVFAIAGRGAPGRPHVRQALLNTGAVADEDAVWRLLGDDSPANVPKLTVGPAEVIRVVREARGVPVLAHPAVNNTDMFLPELLRMGLQAVEVYHPSHNVVKVRELQGLARRFGLAVSGGSDFHGRALDTLGGCSINQKELAALRARRR